MRFFGIWLFVQLLFGIDYMSVSAQTSRETFFDQINKVEEQMTEHQVEAILGKPDEVIGKRTIFSGDIVWKYGVTKRNGLASLGRVEFDRQGRVSIIYGNSETPIDVEIMEEQRLRMILQKIDDIDDPFNPYRLMELVNELQPLGQKKSFSIFREYQRVAFPDLNVDGVYLLMKCLHIVPQDPGYLPSVRRNGHLPPEPESLKQAPRFPIHLLDDIPLLLVTGVRTEGNILRIDGRLKEFEEKIEWKSEGLDVSQLSKDEIEVLLLQFRNSPAWYFRGEAVSELMYEKLKNQVRIFVSTRTEEMEKLRKSSLPNTGRQKEQR